MEEQLIDFLIDVRVRMFSGESEKQKEILTKLDELILAELNKANTQEPA